MRFRHPDGSTVHLAYCTNVHPAEDLAGVIGQLSGCASLVRERLGVPVLGVGLWLAHDLAALLARDGTALKQLSDALDRCGLEVVTLNGFPYAGFHDEVVGKKVYLPDWSEPERLAYTLDLVEVLARLLPDDAAYGSISTLPLGWGTTWTPDREELARAAFDRFETRLAEVGRIRVGIEPEPGCVIETVTQAAHWLAAYGEDRDLASEARLRRLMGQGQAADGEDRDLASEARLRRLMGQGQAADDAGSDYLGACVDTCHLAVQFEDPRTVLGGVRVVKAQVSAALHVEKPSEARELLMEFAEPKFLHQTRERGGPQVDNLDAVSALPGRAPWRVHFHVPVHAAPRPPLASTTDVLDEALGVLLGGAAPLTHHLESETYTWSVLPEPPRDIEELAAGIAGELAWLQDRLVAHGLELIT